MVRFEPYTLPPEAMERASRLRSEIAGNQVLIACYRLGLLLRKANFDPNEPRVPAGSREGGRWTGGGATGTSGSQTGSGHAGATRIAANSDPLKQRSGSNHAARVSNTLNAIATGRSASVSTTVGTGPESATVRVDRQQGNQVMLNISTAIGSVQATGTMSSGPGKVAISNLKATTPGFLNPLTIVSAPTQVTIFDMSDGRLGFELDKRLTIHGPLGVTVIDRSPGQYVVP